MKIVTFLIAFVLFFSTWTYSQIEQMQKKIEDVGVESQGLFTLRFHYASNGAPVPYATITIKGIKSILTDAEGKIRFEKKSDGVYPFKFEKNGFISEDFQLKVRSGKIVNNRFIVSEILKKDAFRVALVWDENPKDLDINFIKDETYRISSKDLNKSPDSLVVLENDSEIGYGPESVIFYNIDSIGSAAFVVSDFSNKDDENSIALSRSDALIKIYHYRKLIQTWKPSKKQSGNIWMVFTIENGQIIPTEEVMEY